MPTHTLVSGGERGHNAIVDAIYLDHNATSPIHPEVVEAICACWSTVRANSASVHRPGQNARHVLESAREEVAELLGASLSHPYPDEVLFTSGGTEANNLAILGVCGEDSAAPGQIIVSGMEHPSVLEPAEHLLERGWRLETLSVHPDGRVCAEQLSNLLQTPTKLVSVMLANHETGVLQPVAAIAAECNAAGVPLHTDAVQVAGKVPINFRQLGVAAMTVSAHKFRGPMGIGALLMRRDTALAPRLFGGHQQGGLRPGSEPVALAVGLATALRIACREQEAERKRLTALRDRLEAGLKAGWPGAVVHGAGAPRLPQTTSIAFPGVDAEMLLLTLDRDGVACSVGSACSSGSAELSPTLRAMGLPGHLARSSLRLSLGCTNTMEQMDEAARRIVHACREIA
ncbi:MAG: cysteine desulfurase family protein [Patescibacteria group bacterium]|nr:cysteine desulfurase family protein [Patescibacteria group bacterium]